MKSKYSHQTQCQKHSKWIRSKDHSTGGFPHAPVCTAAWYNRAMLSRHHKYLLLFYMFFSDDSSQLPPPPPPPSESSRGKVGLGYISALAPSASRGIPAAAPTPAALRGGDLRPSVELQVLQTRKVGCGVCFVPALISGDRPRFIVPPK